MENREQNLEPKRIAQKYEKILRDYVAKLKAGGITTDEARDIYKAALAKLMKLEEHGGSAHDKASVIELSARMKREVKFRIENVLDQPNE